MVVLRQSQQLLQGTPDACNHPQARGWRIKCRGEWPWAPSSMRCGPRRAAQGGSISVIVVENQNPSVRHVSPSRSGTIWKGWSPHAHWNVSFADWSGSLHLRGWCVY